ncbi:hypothetical protein V2J09_002728 [Rumex salicifolius]
MDCTPPSLKSEPPHKSKSASRLALTVSDTDLGSEPEQIPHFSVEIAPPTNTKTPSKSPADSLPLRDLLLLSPSSPARRSTRTRLSDRLEAGEDPVTEQAGNRRRGRPRTSSVAQVGCASPRNGRRSRRRLEVEVREERESVAATADEAPKPRKRRNTGRSKKEKLPAIASTSAAPLTKEENEADQNEALSGLGQLVSDLIMWRDAAKSSFWFGSGCLFFLSSSFTRGLSYSLFSGVSQLGLLYLGVSFLSSTLNQRNNTKKVGEFKLKEEDILRAARVVLPAINLFLTKAGVLFSGEPSMTLKVAIFLLFGAEYGHLLTLWRLCVIAFFASFSVPKLYSSYAAQINTIVENGKSRVLKAWESFSRKKLVITLAATTFWNLSSVKSRIFAAFLSLVILRYVRQKKSQTD